MNTYTVTVEKSDEDCSRTLTIVASTEYDAMGIASLSGWTPVDCVLS